MKKYTIFLILFLFLYMLGFAVNTNSISFISPFIIASGDSAYSLPLSNESFLLNPSLMFKKDNFEFSFGYNDYFGLNLLPINQMSVFVPGIDYSQLFAILQTSNNQSQNIDSLSFSQKTYLYSGAIDYKPVTIGFSMRYTSVVGSFPKEEYISSDISIYSKANNFAYSVIFRNILTYTFASTTTHPNPSALFSTSYNGMKNLFLTAKIQTFTDHINTGLGAIYDLSNSFKVISGINFDNLSLKYCAIGLSFSYSNLTFQYALNYNLTIGNFYNYLTFGADF